jgi:microcompartment protein CcmK/EutM
MGQVVFTCNYNSEKTEVALDVTHLAIGVYVLKVNGTSVRKLVKN